MAAVRNFMLWFTGHAVLVCILQSFYRCLRTNSITYNALLYCFINSLKPETCSAEPAVHVYISILTPPPEEYHLATSPTKHAAGKVIAPQLPIGRLRTEAANRLEPTSFISNRAREAKTVLRSQGSNMALL